MTQYRSHLPQLEGKLFLTDGGLETTLIFHEGLEVPDFAAFDLLKTSDGEAALEKYFATYVEIAERFHAGLILESATWRASADWGTRLGYTRKSLADANRHAIRLLENIRTAHESGQTPVVISGCIGPRGDGYIPTQLMSEGQAEDYHREQMETFAETSADMVCAMTMNYTEEAVGVARAARRVGMPVVISFTVETDGNLPNGQTLTAAIEAVDAATSHYPSYYMINCAHPVHFEHVLAENGPLLQRIHGVRANASRMSHSELNEAAVLDAGNPVELGRQYAQLKRQFAQLNVLGGCCGTDNRHVEQIAAACAPLF